MKAVLVFNGFEESSAFFKHGEYRLSHVRTLGSLHALVVAHEKVNNFKCPWEISAVREASP